MLQLNGVSVSQDENGNVEYTQQYDLTLENKKNFYDRPNGGGESSLAKAIIALISNRRRILWTARISRAADHRARASRDRLPFQLPARFKGLRSGFFSNLAPARTAK